MAKKKRKRKMPPALAAYWAKRRGKGKARRGRAKSKTTVTLTRQVKRVSNPALCALYAVKGADRLKYLGGIKFGKSGRARLFRSSAAAAELGRTLKQAFPQALKGFRLVASRAR